MSRKIEIPSMAGDDCGFDVAVAVAHVTEHLLQSRERRFTGYVIIGADLALGDEREGAANGFRCVMERRFQRDLRVVETLGVEVDLGAAGASAEEVDGTALANHVDGPFPGFGTTDGFDDDVGATAIGS